MAATDWRQSSAAVAVRILLYAWVAAAASSRRQAAERGGSSRWRALGGGVFDFFLIRFLLLTTVHAHLLHAVLENSTISLKNHQKISMFG